MGEEDFEPFKQSSASESEAHPPNVSDRRTAHAAEYSARQLRQISRKLDLLIKAIEKLTPKP
jgi:hypothetical protein